MTQICFVLFWASLHLINSCVFSDRKTIWFVKTIPFATGHINLSPQMDINLIFNSRAICKFNGVHVNKSNRYALHFIHHKPFSRWKTATGERERHQHWKDKLDLLLLMNMIVCWASTFSFICSNFHFDLLKSYCSSVCCINAVMSSYVTSYSL